MNSDKRKYFKLFVGLLMDFLGLVSSSWVIPILGDFSDIIWAPIAAFIMRLMYKSNAGKIASWITFFEEAIPGLDFIPTFSLMWIYNYVIDRKQILPEKTINDYTHE